MLPLLALVLGGAAGVLVERRHTGGWWRRDGDPPDRPRVVAMVCAGAASWSVTTVVHQHRGLPAAETVLTVLVETLLLAGARVDIVTHRLPDRVTLPAGVLAAGAIALHATAPDGHGAALAAVAYAVLTPLVLFAVTLLVGGIGLGDVKASVAVAAVLRLCGLGPLAAGLGLAWAGAATAGLLHLARGAPRDSPIALGPYLWAGTVLGPLLAG